MVADAVSLSAAADTPDARLALNRALAAEAALSAKQATVSAAKGGGRAGVRAEWRASVREVLDQEQSAKGVLRSAPDEAMAVLPPGWHIAQSTDGNLPGRRYRCISKRADGSCAAPKFLTKNPDGRWELLTKVKSNKAHAF